MSNPGPTVAPLPGMPPENMNGPFPWCNWVIGRQVLVGAFPATLDDEETNEILTVLLELGISTFVCLQAEFRLDQPEGSWRNGIGLRPYIKDATTLLGTAAAQSNPKIIQKKLDFLHLAIIDGTITTDAAIERLEEDVRHRILRGEGIYVHCEPSALISASLEDVHQSAGRFPPKQTTPTELLSRRLKYLLFKRAGRKPRGLNPRFPRKTYRLLSAGWGGHGRTGTLVALLLSSLYGLGAQRALAYTQALHDCRGNPQGVRSPQTRIQRDQVRRIISRRAQQNISLSLRAPYIGATKGVEPADGKPGATMKSAARKGSGSWKQQRGTGGRLSAESNGVSVTTAGSQPYRPIAKEKQTPATYRSLSQPKSQEGLPTAAPTWLHRQMREESSAEQQKHPLEHPRDSGSDVLIRAGRFGSGEGLEMGGSSAESEIAERRSHSANEQGKSSALPRDRSLPALLQSYHLLSGERSDVSQQRPKTALPPRRESGKSFASGIAALLRASKQASVDRSLFAHLPTPQRPGPSREASGISHSSSLTPALRAASRPSSAARESVAALNFAAASSAGAAMRPWVPATGSSSVPQVSSARDDLVLPASMARDLKGVGIERQSFRSRSVRQTPRQSADLAVVNVNLQQSCRTGKRPGSSHGTAPLSARILQSGDHGSLPRSTYRAADEPLMGEMADFYFYSTGRSH